MRKILRKIRDHSLVLPILVRALIVARKLGFLRSPQIYAHVPYRGLVTVDCGEDSSFRIQSEGHKVENSLFWDGLFGHEPETMRLWWRLARTSKTVLDIGANSGVFGLAAGAAGAQQVFAFEPVPRVYRILKKNTALNPELPIQPIQAAVGSTPGKAVLYDPGGNAPTSASLSKEFADAHEAQFVEGEVEVVRIDDYRKKNKLVEIDLIKIDVEGFEVEALSGMKETVDSNRPEIVLEVLPKQRKEIKQAVEHLWPGVFEWVNIDEGPGHTSRNVHLSPRR